MRRLIDANALRDKLQEEIDKAIPPYDDVIGSIRCGVRLARNIVEDEPTIDSELILCKDCRHRPHKDEAGNVIPHNVELDPCPCICNDDWWYNRMPDDEFYCGNAEPKEDDG